MRLYQPSKKTLSYIRRMISTGNWKPNEAIPTIGTIANKLSVSTPTVKKVLKILEREKTIINHGSLGRFVLSDVLVKQHKLSRTSMLVHLASVNIDAAEMHYLKKKFYGRYGIGYDTKAKLIYAHNIITHESLTATVNELNDIIVSPITIQLMLESPTNKVSALKHKYKRQQKLHSLARIVHFNKTDLGIPHE